LEADADLLAVEWNAGAVLLDHFQRRFLDLLVRVERPLALDVQSLAPATDDDLLARPRVDHLRFAVTAEWTDHGAHHMRKAAARPTRSIPARNRTPGSRFTLSDAPPGNQSHSRHAPAR